MNFLRLSVSSLLVASLLIAACQLAPARVNKDGQHFDRMNPDLEWPMEGRLADRARSLPRELSPPLLLNSTVVIGGDTQFGSPVTAAQNTLFVEGERSLHAIFADTGQKKWVINLLGSYLSPAVYGNAVFVRVESGDSGYVMALTIENGAKLWEYWFPAAGSGYDNVGGHVTSPVIANGLVVVGAARTLYALDAKNGDVRWQTQLAEPVASSATIADEMVYITDFTHLYALDLHTGEIKWQFAQEVVTLQFAPLATKTHVIITGGDIVYAIERASGAVAWSSAKSGLDVIPAGVNGDVVYVKSINTLFAISAGDGHSLWEYPTVNFVSLPAAAGEYVYVITRAEGGSQLRVLRQSDGSESWRTDNMAFANAAPSIAYNRVFVRTVDGRVVTFVPQKE